MRFVHGNSVRMVNVLYNNIYSDVRMFWRSEKIIINLLNFKQVSDIIYSLKI